jgi:hypothetical protein
MLMNAVIRDVAAVYLRSPGWLRSGMPARV